MSLIRASHDSLPYIDRDITESERAQADKIIAAALAPEYQRTLHPLIPPEAVANLSPLIRAEIDRKRVGGPRQGGIDLARYEAPDAPADKDDDQGREAWQKVLRQAYASNSYLSGRLVNLSLLDDLGKNAWLIGNSQLEDTLRGLEKELADLKTATEDVNKARKAAQEDSRGEIVNLEDTWKQGIGRILEVEVATDALRQEIAQRRQQAEP